MREVNAALRELLDSGRRDAIKRLEWAKRDRDVAAASLAEAEATIADSNETIEYLDRLLQDEKKGNA